MVIAHDDDDDEQRDCETTTLISTAPIHKGNSNITSPHTTITNCGVGGGGGGGGGGERKKKESSATYTSEREQCIKYFEKWSEQDQLEFTEHLLSRMCHYQHGHIDAFLKPMLQRDFISLLPSKYKFFLW